MIAPGDVAVAFPTYGRERVLVESVEHVLAASPAPGEILVVDQTPRHDEATERALRTHAEAGRIRWLRRSTPSITAAMNAALGSATRPVVLFLDDDVVPRADLVGAHAAAYESDDTWAVAGQVLQPGEEPTRPRPYTRAGMSRFLDFPFHSDARAFVENGMAGNLSVRREAALRVGGFDENFVGVAYRFETEFCRRLCAGGGRILFEPAASLRHLRASSGGTRAFGDHRASASPLHGVGDYYFALRQRAGLAGLGYVLRRPVREVATRFHLRRPWWIPVKLLGELRGLAYAVRLIRRGPALLARPPEIA